MASLQLCIKAGELIRPRLKSHIRVLKGELWLTKEGDLDDHFMQAGDDVELIPAEAPLMQAIHGHALVSMNILDTNDRLY